MFFSKLIKPNIVKQKQITLNINTMKALKTIKYALIIASIFTFSACELIEEPNMDESTCTGCTETSQGEID